MEVVSKFVNNYLDSFKPYKGELAWNYEDGCVLIGALRLFDATQEMRYYDFVYNYLNKRIDENGTISNYSYLDFNIDSINAGKSLFSVYKVSGEERFKKAKDVVDKLL